MFAEEKAATVTSASAGNSMFPAAVPTAVTEATAAILSLKWMTV